MAPVLVAMMTSSIPELALAVPALAIYATSVAGPEGIAPFIYFQF